jgi:hypothetical protein
MKFQGPRLLGTPLSKCGSEERYWEREIEEDNWTSTRTRIRKEDYIEARSRKGAHAFDAAAL